MHQSASALAAAAATEQHARMQRVLDDAVEAALEDRSGEIARYCRDLRDVNEEHLGVAIRLVDGTLLSSGDAVEDAVTLQSVAKVVLLTGLLEDLGPDAVFDLVGMEPSGDSFKSLARIDARPGPPANPLINAGAIMLSSCVPGETIDERVDWIRGWAAKLFEVELTINEDVRKAERVTGDHNRSIGYLLRSKDLMERSVSDTLEAYFALCSLQADVRTAANLPALLSRGGVSRDGERVLQLETVRTVLAIMTTCGMYDESGAHLVDIGLPAKSGVSGMIISAAPGRAGIAAYSPRLGPKGASVRGQIMLRHIARELGWHFAG